MEQILEIDEFILLQNPIVGSHLIYQFTKEYYSVKNNKCIYNRLLLNIL